MEQKELESTPNYFRLVFVNWYKVVAGMLICAIAGAIFAALEPPVYESTAMLLVYPPFFKDAGGSTRARTEEEAKLYLDEMMPRTLSVDTYRAIAESKEIVKAIIDELQLENVTVEGLGSRLEVELVREGTRGTSYSQIILFHARSSVPERAKQVADKWAYLFKAKVDKVAQNGIVETTDLIEEMWEKTKADLERAEGELETFTREANLDLMKSRKEFKEELLSMLEEELDLTQVDIATARAELAALQKELKEEDKIETLFKAPSDDVYWLLKKNLTGDEEGPVSPKDGLLTEEYNPNYGPARDSEIEVHAELQGSESKRAELVSAIEDLNHEIGDLQKEIAEKETKFKQLTRNVTTVESTYDLVAAKREKGKIAKTNIASDIQIAADAVEPENPVGARRMLTVAAAAVVGALISMGYVVAEYSIRTTPSVASG